VDRLDAPRGQLLLQRVVLTCCNVLHVATCYMLRLLNTLLKHVAT
jgi:hypothetical protein